MPTNPRPVRNLRRPTIPTPHVSALVSLAATLVLTTSDLTAATTTTINAKSASQSDVAAAIASAADGDTVTIPAGRTSWTRTLGVTKGITIQGAGVGATIIKDSVQSGQLIQWTLPARYPSRLTGIEFQDGGRVNTIDAPGGILHVDGSNTNGSTFRFDHCKWNNLNGATVFDTVIGVIDHNTFVMDRFGCAIYPYGSHWDGQNYGDGSWHAPTNYGSSQFLFIEDNTFTHSQHNLRGMIDAYAGARFVVRYNTIFNSLITNHGTESTGRTRGCRAMEIYNNNFDGTNLNSQLGGSRSGGTLFHDNTISGYSGNLAAFDLQNYRNIYPFQPWGGADGTNAWDVNEPTVFFTGKAAANSSGASVTISGANWTANQWAGYTLRRTTDICNSGSLNFGWIVSNTSKTISYASNPGYPTPPSMSFCTGDSLEIRKIDHALDQPGRARGSLIAGDSPVRPGGWNDQVTEPCYSWNNTNEVNGQVNFSAGPSVRANVHYFNNTPMPGYTPYTYPHPLVSGNPPPSPMSSSRPTTRTSLRTPWGGWKQKEKKGVTRPRRKAKEKPASGVAEGAQNLGN
ncbi:MAG TPA: hypothetical protein VFA61_05960 [Candidatus Udaeobacter sp.]|nr:hypothetical protein [Candidatus Udaeobacter sp.]